ncbi:TonB-dependent receptor domain-containing protein [Aquirufa sp. ROCK-SH2]
MKKYHLIFILLFFAQWCLGQNSKITLSGTVVSKVNSPIEFATVILKKSVDSSFVSGTITSSNGLFKLTDISSGNYIIYISSIGYESVRRPVYIGSISAFIDLAKIELNDSQTELTEVIVADRKDEVGQQMDRKTYKLENSVAQAGSSVLQVMQTLPGITIQEGKLNLRGSSQVTVLVDGKQTALTGFGAQTSLDNIPASAIDKIEIINNPSAKFDANGNAGIINIIFKKNNQEGINGKLTLLGGLGALWVKKENLPGIREQFTQTPKFNPSISFNYRKRKTNFFFQGDFNFTPTLNKNEFVTRSYSDGTVIQQQTKRNRRTTIGTIMTGLDWQINDQNLFNHSILFSSEKILDDGDEPFYNQDFTQRKRLWQFLEDEVKTTVTAINSYQYKFLQPGHVLNVGANYTWHQEDEKYFFTNIYPSYTGYDSFKLMSDENVLDFSLDYVRPLRWGKIESGLKFRYRFIPTSMLFIPGLNSPLDVTAGGWADYKESIPAIYSNYVFENEHLEFEAGLRMEYVKVNYDVDPKHNTYSSNGYVYTQPFPSFRFAYKLTENNRLSFFFNRRVDRPAELDIRVFPKYDDAEIVKVGNPALKPQFTNSFELGFKTNFKQGYLFSSLYYKAADATINRIAVTLPESTLIYNIMQNAGKSALIGTEWVFAQTVNAIFRYNFNFNLYQNTIDAFSVINQYPKPTFYQSEVQQMISWNLKANAFLKLNNGLEAQISSVYLAPDIIPQGKIGQRFSVDFGMKKVLKKSNAEIFLNLSDVLNTLNIYKEIQGSNFKMTSKDFYETQVMRLGYSKKF